jgi:hypothetical protein
MKIVASHNDNLKPGEPQLNWCDVSVMVSPEAQKENIENHFLTQFCISFTKIT